MKRAINRPRKSMWTRIKTHKYIYLMLLPVVIYYIVFHHVNEMTLKFITGEASLDEFDSFVEQVWDSGLQEVLDIMNAAYADYMNIKAPQK